MTTTVWPDRELTAPATVIASVAKDEWSDVCGVVGDWMVVIGEVVSSGLGVLTGVKASFAFIWRKMLMPMM